MVRSFQCEADSATWYGLSRLLLSLHLRWTTPQSEWLAARARRDAEAKMERREATGCIRCLWQSELKGDNEVVSATKRTIRSVTARPLTI
jgi:hypothetical protein